MSESELVKAHQPCPDCGNTEEIWRDVPGYEGYYQVSNHGRVRGLDRFIKSKNGSRQKINGKVIKPRVSESGYISVQLRKNGKVLHTNLSRVVAQVFIPNPENKPEVDHIDTDKTNNHVSNLRWVTRYENQHNKLTERKTCIFYKGRIAATVAAEHGISLKAFRTRISRGWPIEEACTRHSTKGGKHVRRN